MNKENLKALAANPDLVPGIYNYCDRWCERCSMTTKCLTYLTIAEEDAAEPGANDFRNELFWKKIGESLGMAFSLLQEYAEENNIDLSTTEEEDEAFKKKAEAERETINQSAITQLAKQYQIQGSKWLDNSHSLLIQKGNDINQAIQLGLTDQSPEEEVKLLEEALEVVSYYLFQIYVKMMRAQHRSDEPLLDDDGVPFPKDSDGSAKVALLGMDRSIGAWGILLQVLPDAETSILELLSILERLRKLVEKEFPDARKFVRPGFDDVI
jgi:hypothetical protein